MNNDRSKQILTRGENINKLVTTDNFNILLTKNTLIHICNNISKKINRKISDVSSVINYIKQMNVSIIQNKPLPTAINIISDKYINDVINGREKVPNMEEYQKRELNQLTDNENPLKLSSFPDKRGNAVIDKNRVRKHNSSPNNVPPYKDTSIKNRNNKALENISEMADIFKSFLSPESTDEIFKTLRQTWTTYGTVALPRQTISFDSRNRDLYNPNTTYSWKLHASGNIGNIGDIKTQDSLQQIIQMKICPFWMPVPVGENQYDYYSKIRILIREFKDQSVLVTEFLDNNEVIDKNFHFEMEIKEINIDRIYLVPCNDTYKFIKPWARVETITIEFLTPYEYLNADIDRSIFSVSSANPAVFTSITPHSLSTGDLIYILDYNSGISQLDNEINRKKGYNITKIDNYSFSIPIDTTSAAVVNNVSVYFGSKRVFINIEFISLE